MNNQNQIPVRNYMRKNQTTQLVVGKKMFIGQIKFLWLNVAATTIVVIIVGVFIGVF